MKLKVIERSELWVSDRIVKEFIASDETDILKFLLNEHPEIIFNRVNEEIQYTLEKEPEEIE